MNLLMNLRLTFGETPHKFHFWTDFIEALRGRKMRRTSEAEQPSRIKGTNQTSNPLVIILGALDVKEQG